MDTMCRNDIFGLGQSQPAYVPGKSWDEVNEAIRQVSSEDADELVAELLREARAALAQEHAELVMLLRAPDKLAVITFDPMGLITSVTKNSPELLGQPVERLIGQPIDAFLRDRGTAVKESCDEMTRAEQGNTVHSRRSHLRKDGTNFEADHTLVAVVGDEEYVKGFVRQIREVTDHKIREVHIAELDRIIAFLLDQ